jgi:hypothetical protein
LQKLPDRLGLPLIPDGGFSACLDPDFEPDFHPAGPFILIHIIADNMRPFNHSGRVIRVIYRVFPGAIYCRHSDLSISLRT